MSNRFRASLTSMSAKATPAYLLRSRRNYVRAHAARSQVKELMRPADCDAAAAPSVHSCGVNLRTGIANA